MPFTTQADLSKAVGGDAVLVSLSDVDGLAIDTDAVAAAIAEADTTIRASCAHRPGFSSPAFAAAVLPLATNLAIGYLYRNVWQSIPKDRYGVAFKEAEALLAQVREGKVSLVEADPPAEVVVAQADFYGPADPIDETDSRQTSLRTLRYL